MTTGGYRGAMALIGFAGLGLLAMVQRLIEGEWQSPERFAPMAIYFVVMLCFIGYRRSRSLDPNPPWLMIGIGVVGLAVCGFWLTQENRPDGPLEWLGFVVIAAVPIALVVAGIRHWRAGVHAASASSRQSPT